MVTAVGIKIYVHHHMIMCMHMCVCVCVCLSVCLSASDPISSGHSALCFTTPSNSYDVYFSFSVMAYYFKSFSDCLTHQNTSTHGLCVKNEAYRYVQMLKQLYILQKLYFIDPKFLRCMK